MPFSVGVLVDVVHRWLFPSTRVHSRRIERWLPPTHRGSFSRDARRMHMFVRNAVGLVQVMLPVAVLFVFARMWLSALLILALVAITMVSLFVHRAGRALLAADLFLASLLVSVAVAAWCAQEQFLAIWIWAPTIPITALCVGGTRAGVRWLLYSVTAALTVVLVRALGFAPPAHLNLRFGLAADVGTGLGALVSLVGIAGSYGNDQRQLFEEVEARNRDLEAARARLESLNGDLARARDEAEAGGRARSEFLATISHEIRTPMNAVIGMTTLLLDAPIGPEQRGFVEVIRASGESLLTLLNDTLDYSKIEAGHIELESLTFDPRAELTQVVELMRGAAQARGNALALVVDDATPRALRSDPGRLRQVLLNLVANAVKFTRDGRVEVRLAFEPAARALVVAVRDTGIGIAPEMLTHIFEPFTQADASTTRRFGGTGLGLAISKRLATLLGGALTVESALGAGTTFTLRVPVEVADERVSTLAPEPVEPAAALPTGRVLVAEDNVVNQKVIALMLQRWGHRVDTVANGVEALAALERAPYALVLMDLQMPEMDGLEATRRLRARGDAVRVVALTANVSPEDRARCAAVGMDGFLAKPIRNAELTAILQGSGLNGTAPRSAEAG